MEKEKLDQAVKVLQDQESLKYLYEDLQEAHRACENHDLSSLAKNLDEIGRYKNQDYVEYRVSKQIQNEICDYAVKLVERELEGVQNEQKHLDEIFKAI